MLLLELSVLANDSKEDVVDGEDEVNVEEESNEAVMAQDKSNSLEDEEEETALLKSNPDVDTFFLFTKPSGMGLGMLHIITLWSNILPQL